MLESKGVARASSRALLLVGCAAFAAGAFGAQSASATDIFGGANLVVSTLTYTGDASTVAIGQTLPGGGTAIANGAYPNVFANDTVDSSFGVTAPYVLQALKVTGAAAKVVNTIPVTGGPFVGSFSSKSEGALNLSADGRVITFMGYASTINQLDISNSNTPGAVDPTNPVTAPSTDRAIAQVNGQGKFTFTDVNSYSGNNGRAAILGSNGMIYTVGNAGNGGNPQPASIVNGTGVQVVNPATGSTSKVGAFSITQVPGNTKPDKVGKDDNYRGETIFNNTLYVTKGSGSNGINTVYQVGTAGSLPGAGTSTPITILPGFPTGLAKNDTNFFPFGIWFANSTTLYVADEGDGTMADAGTDIMAGLEKWSNVGGTWKLDYTLQNGLGLGQSYGVDGYPANLDPTTDGLRNITGRVNADGTVTIYGVTSTVSASGDQGADPNRLVAINDALGDTTLPNKESFGVLETAVYGQVLRGVSVAPIPEPATWSMMLLGFGGLGTMMRSARRRRAALEA
jgi:hypothetical protein